MGIRSSIQRAIEEAASYDFGRHGKVTDLYGDRLYSEVFPSSSLQERAFYNFGAGNWRHRFWQNIDYASDWYHYDQSLIDIPWDITEATCLPVRDNSAELCYSSHTVEHLLNEHVDHMLREACRILKPGGVLRVTAPNIELYHQAWRRRDIFVNYHYSCPYPFGGHPTTFTKDRMSIWLVNEFATQLVQSARPGHTPKYQSSEKLLDDLLETTRMEVAFDQLCSEIDFDLQRAAPGHHVNWWTNKKLCAAMKRAGFSETIVSIAGGSISPAIRDLAHFDRLLPTVSLFVDGVK